MADGVVARRLTLFGLMLVGLSLVARFDEVLIVDRGGVGVVLGLVHFELVGAQLLVQLARHRVRLGRLDLLLHLVEVVCLEVVVEEASRTFLLQSLRCQLLQLTLDYFRYFQLEYAGVGLELGGEGLIDLRLQVLLREALVLAVGASAVAATTFVCIPGSISRLLGGQLQGVRLLGLPLVLLKSLELLGEHLDLGHELDLVVPELDELIHHAVTLLLALLAAFTGTLSVLQLPIIKCIEVRNIETLVK